MKSFGVKHILKYPSGPSAVCLLAVLLCALAACTPSADNSMLALDAAWVRAAPPGMKMTAGFGLLTNHGERQIQITGFSSPDFASVSLHQTVLRDGVSRMREIPSLTIQAGESFEMSPGGYHLMLMMPTGPVEAGATVTLVINLETGDTLTFRINVEGR